MTDSKVVPVEPTEEMIQAGWDAQPGWPPKKQSTDIYKAMLAALLLGEGMMGFVLQSMIEDLEEALKTGDLEYVAERLAWWKSYAIQCGEMEQTK